MCFKGCEMRLHYKSILLSHYGTGTDVYIATSNGDNRVLVFDSNVIMALTWRDIRNKKDNFGISVNKTTLLKLAKSIRPKNGYYEIILKNSYDLCILDEGRYAETSDILRSSLVCMPYINADPNRFNHYFAGLIANKSKISGNVTLDLDKFKDVIEFLTNYISSGMFLDGQIRIVNFQVVNEGLPLVVQSFVKFDNIVGNLDIAILPFKD